MKNYKQLTAQQRYQIEALLQVGCTQTAIADQIGVHRSTISRELKRSIALRGSDLWKLCGHKCGAKDKEPT